MGNFERWKGLMAQGLLLNVALSYFAFMLEVANQHYYRGRFRRPEMYFPAIVAPIAAAGTLLRAFSNSPAVKALYTLGTMAALFVGLIGSFYHITANFRVYQARKPKGEPQPGQAKQGPRPNIEIAGYHVGRLLETGAAMQPWLCPPSLAGLAIFGGLAGLLLEGERKGFRCFFH